MPNHTSNKLVLSGDSLQIAAFIAAMTTAESNFDFNGVVPMPAALQNTEKSYGAQYTPEQLQAKASLVEKYGADNWYDWSNKNWGTKWNAYEVGNWRGDMITFQTAWSPPMGFLAKASDIYPDVDFTISYADEGGGFLGTSVIQNGVVVSEVDLGWDDAEGIALRKELGVWSNEEE